MVNLPHWTLHDLRRTVRTNLSRLGVIQEVAEAVVAHRKQGVVKVYNRYDYLTETRAALEAWSTRLLEIVGRSHLNSNAS
jgi:integrase